MKKFALALLGFTTLALLFPTATFASSLAFDLSTCNTGLIGGTSPGPCGQTYGVVTITDISGGVTVDVTLENGAAFANTGLLGFAFDLDKAATGVTGITTGTPPVAGGFTYDNPVSGSPLGHDDGAGTFTNSLSCTGCGSGGSSPLAGPLDFTVNGVSTSDFISDGTAIFAADVFINGGTLNGKTGLIMTNVPTTTTPEPASLALFGTGLFSIAGVLRRKIKK